MVYHGHLGAKREQKGCNELKLKGCISPFVLANKALKEIDQKSNENGQLVLRRVVPQRRIISPNDLECIDAEVKAQITMI